MVHQSVSTKNNAEYFERIENYQDFIKNMQIFKAIYEDDMKLLSRQMEINELHYRNNKKEIERLVSSYF